jgi:hypothetical protein
MDWLNKILKKIGTDKALHFLVGALITAWAGLLGEYYLLMSTVVVFAIAYTKEEFDNVFDVKDIIATMLGSVTSVVVYLVLQLALLV